MRNTAYSKKNKTKQNTTSAFHVQEAQCPKRVRHQWFLRIGAVMLKMPFGSLPDSRSCDDPDEQDSTPAERVARRENENVLEEEGVQLC